MQMRWISVATTAVCVAFGCDASDRDFTNTNGTASDGGSMGPEPTAAISTQPQLGNGGDGAAITPPPPGVGSPTATGGAGSLGEPSGGSPGQLGGNGQGGSSPGGAPTGGGTSSQGGAGAGGTVAQAGSGGAPTPLCTSPMTLCDGNCVDTLESGAHCGGCGIECDEGSVCASGTCQSTCEGDQVPCTNSCADLSSSVQHCGACGTACAVPVFGRAVCDEGDCGIACDGTFSECQGECVDYSSDENHCGGCQRPCDGECISGECCPLDRQNCQGQCVDTESNAQHCGGCGTSCDADEVCEDGTCLADCQNADRCGNDCVDLSSDLENCTSCGETCSPPAANGRAVCNASGCDIECNAGSLRCGDACCNPPPANATTNCNGGTCGVQCNANYHACNGTSSPCYANTDAQKCGTSCTNCTQPNATAACVSGQCSNTCDGHSFSCQYPDGKPACGSWDFESGTTEGWSIDATFTDASTGLLAASTARVTSGFNSLAIGYDGDGTDVIVDITIQLCPSGQPVNLSGLSLELDSYAETATGTQAYPSNQSGHYVIAYNGASGVFGGCDFYPDPDQFFSLSCTNLPAQVTHIVLRFRVFVPWRGTLYIDNVRFE